MSAAPTVAISDLNDVRIAPYLGLKERDLAREGGRFIAEGELVVRRLLVSSYETESVLAAAERLSEIAPAVPAHVPIYVAEHSLVNRIVGFKFHSGIMAVGLRGPRRTLAEVAGAWGDRPVTLVICPQVEKTDNMGALIRIAAGFGVDAMILGERCCDPFYRQSIRVSMGSIFTMPLVRSDELVRDLRTLHDQYGVELVATVLADDAEPLAGARRSARLGLLFGNEAQGLAAENLAECDRRVTIPMNKGTDSLNVSVAAGIFLYHFTQLWTGSGCPTRRPTSTAPPSPAN